MEKAKKLIEVAMPIKEISAESVRDKSIRHGHISTLHLWWARRPLPVCRAVVFASLIPDPLDENCPLQFRDAVEILLGKQNNDGDPYHPYLDIPWTSVFDPMEDNLRNRLQMFIGKFSTNMQQHLLHQKPKPAAGNQLSDYSLIKWENKNDEIIIGKARKLIWVAHNALSGTNAKDLLADFDTKYTAIKEAEEALYSIPDRHLGTPETQEKEAQLHHAMKAFLDKMPLVFDPFAGGGAIPLEAARLGCRSYGNDINPVAHVLQRCSLEFPQKYGKPIRYSKVEFIQLYGETEWKSLPQNSIIYKDGEASGAEIANRLSFDVKFFAKKIINSAEKEIGHLYPKNEKGERPLVYYWARVGKCSNPTCRAEIPLLRQFNLVNKKEKAVHLAPVINGNKIDFEINNGISEEQEWISRGNLKCPCCGNITNNATLKKQFVEGGTSEKILALIYEGEGTKEYRTPDKENIDVLRSFNPGFKPIEKLPVDYTKAMAFCLWGFEKWGDIFSNRQLIALETFSNKINEIKANLQFDEDYKNAIITSLAVWFDRVASFATTFGVWATTIEAVVTPFSRQAIQMVFDYPEVNIFSSGGGGALGQLDWVIRYLETENAFQFTTKLKNASSGEKEQFVKKTISCVVTDPPYYDAIAYADLSDFFYIWMKKTLNDLYPLNFATPQTPKTDECTALKHHHRNNEKAAKQHFENKLLQIFDAIEHQTSDVVSIMFAHQSTDAWTTLCNSILGASMNISGSWAIDTERSNSGVKVDKAFLSSSVTVSARPSKKEGIGDYKKVRKSIEQKVSREVENLYDLGFRGADLLTACFGQAISEFGKYEKVEKADGSEVTVAELLEMARESAFNALLKGFDGDEFTKFYIGWLQLYSFAESEFDDAAKFSRVGLSINVAELFTEHILIKNGNKQTLGTFEDRIKANRNIGDRAKNFLIDLVHRAMALYKGNNRNLLLQYIGKVASQPESNFWRVVTSLCEVLPAGSEDHKQALGLLTNKDSLIRESKAVQIPSTTQTNLFE
jgi:putative DNA methylase